MKFVIDQFWMILWKRYDEDRFHILSFLNRCKTQIVSTSMKKFHRHLSLFICRSIYCILFCFDNTENRIIFSVIFVIKQVCFSSIIKWRLRERRRWIWIRMTYFFGLSILLILFVKWIRIIKQNLSINIWDLSNKEYD